MKTIKSTIVAADSDLDKAFRPATGLHMTKNGVLDDIRSAGDNSDKWKKVQPPDPTKLTDALMQKYIDDYEVICGDLIQDDISHDDMEEKQADLLFKLAKKIKKAGK